MINIGIVGIVFYGYVFWVFKKSIIKYKSNKRKCVVTVFKGKKIEVWERWVVEVFSC